MFGKLHLIIGSVVNNAIACRVPLTSIMFSTLCDVTHLLFACLANSSPFPYSLKVAAEPPRLLSTKDRRKPASDASARLSALG